VGNIPEAAGPETVRKAAKCLEISAAGAGLASIGAISGVGCAPTPAAAL